MAKSPILTNAQSVDALKPGLLRYHARDSQVHGLELRVNPDGKRTWTLRFRNTAREQRRLRIGAYPRVTLHAARQAATEHLRRIDAGIDPQAERTAAKLEAERAKRDSVESLCADYLERQARPRKRTWRADAHKVNRIILPAWRGRAVSAVTRRDCRELLETIADRGAPIQANRVGALLSRLFRFAVDQELIEVNVAQKLPKLGVEVGARPEGDREIKPYDDGEIRTIWAATDTLEAAPRALFRLGILTGQRPGEIGDASWSEIDGSWLTIPAARAKNGRSHRVYLTPTALKELAAIPRLDDEPRVFRGFRGKRQLALLNRVVFKDVRRRQKPRHALRDTAATNMAAAGVPVEDISRCVNHRVGSVVTSVYNAWQYDREKQSAFEIWEGRLKVIIDQSAAKAAKAGKVLAHWPKAKR